MREAIGNGLTIRPIRTMMNHATTDFDLLRRSCGTGGKPHRRGRQGLSLYLSGMMPNAFSLRQNAIGDAKCSIEKATTYAKERSVFGRPIGQNQGVQFPIAKAYAQMRAAELMVQQAIALYEAGWGELRGGGGPHGQDARRRRLPFEAANVCVQTHGGFGFAEEYDVERKFREARLYQVAPISTNLILSHLAEHVLGLPRSF